jgi:hypothetical protein
MKDLNDEKVWKRMSLEDIRTPKAGRICIGPRWWSVHNGDCLFFRGYYSPQCNKDEEILKRICPELERIYLDMAFIPHSCGDYQ